MSIKDRFKMVMDREKLTAGAFAESIGVAQARREVYFGGSVLDDLMARADTAMYAAKAAGRNRVEQETAMPPGCGKEISHNWDWLRDRCRQEKKPVASDSR